MIGHRWDRGTEVRLIRNVRNDGTYPGKETGEHLVRRGSTGFVIDVGSFLQDQIIYSVHFLQEGIIVGCREEELIGMDEPWVPSRFEFREKVSAGQPLGTKTELRVARGETGEILKVARDAPGGVAYHVHFECLPGRVLLVPETALEKLEDDAEIQHHP